MSDQILSGKTRSIVVWTSGSGGVRTSKSGEVRASKSDEILSRTRSAEVWA